MLPQLLAVCPCFSFHLGLIDLLTSPMKKPPLVQHQHPAPDTGSRNARVLCMTCVQGCFFCVSFKCGGLNVFEMAKTEVSASGSHRSHSSRVKVGVRTACIKPCVCTWGYCTLKQLKKEFAHPLGRWIIQRECSHLGSLTCGAHLEQWSPGSCLQGTRNGCCTSVCCQKPFVVRNPLQSWSRTLHTAEPTWKWSHSLSLSTSL